MKIWLVSLFEPTPYDDSFSARFICIAEECLKLGHEVTFYSSTYKHSTKEQRFDKTTPIELNDNYELLFVKTLPYKKNLSFDRLRSHSRFSEELLKTFDASNEKPDVIFIAYPPISTALSVSRWAVENNVPYIVDIIDPWPDSFRKLMKKVPEKLQNVLLTPFTKKTKEILINAHAITGIAKQRLTWAKKYCENCEEMHYFYPSADLKEVQRKLAEIGKSVEQDDKLRIIYAGSFALSYDIPTILEAAKILSEKYSGKIEFVLAGAGPQENLVNKYTEDYENLRYVGRIPKEELMREYYLADLGLIQHFPGATQTITYKLFDLMSCGIPILNSLESELNDIVIENKVGLFNKSGDSEQLAQNILYFYKNPDKLSEMKQRAIDVTAEIGDTKKVYAEAAEMMERIANKNQLIHA